MAGPKGEKRPRSGHANAVRVAKILTGELQEEYAEHPSPTISRLSCSPIPTTVESAVPTEEHSQAEST